jgi:hypothetical protein
VGGRPQFEVLDPVVQPVPIAMMHDFVGEKRAAEMKGHHQPVLTYLGDPSDEMSKGFGDRNFVITMAEMPEAISLNDRTIRLGIAGGEETLVVGGAKALGLVGPIAVVKRTESSADSPRLVGRNSGAQQPQVWPWQ